MHSLGHLRLLRFRPYFLYRVAKGYFKTIVLRQNVLRVVEFYIDWRCNSNCKRCFAAKFKQKGKEVLTVDEIKDVWGQAKRLGAIAATIGGGEPTISPIINDIIKVLGPKANIVQPITNSLTIDKKLLQHYCDLGMYNICFSLDATTEEENDRIRGHKGHYQKVMQAVKTAQELDMEVYVSFTITHSNLHTLQKMIDFCRDDLKVKLSGSTLVTSGRASDDYKERLTHEDWAKLQEITKKNRRMIRFDLNINYSCRYECPAGREKISIGPYGDVMPCATNHLSFGNIREEPLEVIWKRMGEFKYFKQRANYCLLAIDNPYLNDYIDPITYQDEMPVRLDKHPSAKYVKG